MFLEKYRASKFYVVFVVCISIFTDTFMYGLVVPILPYAFVSRMGIEPSRVQFWNTTFMATWAGAVFLGSVFFGAIADRAFSKRWAFILGQCILGLSTALFVISKNMPLLVVARLLQGFSGGAINTLGYTLTFDAVGQESIGTSIGYVTMSLSLGTFFGPIVGGPLYDAAGYEWVFIPMIILIVIEIVLRILVIEPKPGANSSAIVSDERQRLLSNGADSAPEQHVRRPSQIHARRSSLGNPSKIFDKNSQGKSPLLILLGNRRLVVAMIGLFIGNNFVGAMEATIPVFAAGELGFSSTKAGLLMLCSSAPMFLSPLAGILVDKFGPKWPTAAGFVVGGIGLILLRLTDHPSPARVALVIILLTVYGCSITLFWGPIISEVTFAVEDLEKKKPGAFGENGAISLAFGLQNAAFGAGAMIGPIYAGAILATLGWGTMGMVLGIISLLTAVPVAVYTGGYLFDKKAKKGDNDSTASSEA